jgi:hypothetical protein
MRTSSWPGIGTGSACSRQTNGTYSNVADANLYDCTTPLGQLDDKANQMR